MIEYKIKKELDFYGLTPTFIQKLILLIPYQDEMRRVK